jgi:hypothetical protein
MINISRSACMISGLLLLFGVAQMSLGEGQKASASRGLYGFITEAMARERVSKAVMPDYPEELLQTQTQGQVTAKIEIDTEGNLLTIKVHPTIDPLVKRSLAKALPLWHFKMDAPRNHLPGETILTKLTFNYFIENGIGRVDLYIPPPSAPVIEQLDYLDSGTERNTWAQWETIYPELKSRTPNANQVLSGS